MVKAIVGACWGDEGKGKITDVLAEDSDIVVRFQGGSNAGHTIINEYGKFALHQLPSGVFRQNITNIIGNGVALSVENFIDEVKSVTDRGVPAPKLLVSDRCQVVMPYHKELDGMEEARLAAKSFGSTKSGIAPFYSDKYAKIGFQVSDLFDDKDSIMERIDHVLDVKNVLYTQLYHQKPLDREEIYQKLMEYKEALAPYVADTTTLLHNAVKEGKTILLEGQLGSLKDPDMGIYPMVTSSSPLAGYGAVGAGGIPPYAIQEIVTVVKAYSSAVGAGEFVSEIFGDEAEELRRRGGEAGKTTRRFLGSITHKGYIWRFDSVDALCPKVYELADSWELAGEMLARLHRAAADNGWDTIVCCAPEEPGPAYHRRPAHPAGPVHPGKRRQGEW